MCHSARFSLVSVGQLCSEMFTNKSNRIPLLALYRTYLPPQMQCGHTTCTAHVSFACVCYAVLFASLDLLTPFLISFFPKQANLTCYVSACCCQSVGSRVFESISRMRNIMETIPRCVQQRVSTCRQPTQSTNPGLAVVEMNFP